MEERRADRLDSVVAEEEVVFGIGTIVGDGCCARDTYDDGDGADGMAGLPILEVDVIAESSGRGGRTAIVGPVGMPLDSLLALMILSSTFAFASFCLAASSASARSLSASSASISSNRPPPPPRALSTKSPPAADDMIAFLFRFCLLICGNDSSARSLHQSNN